MAKTVRIRVNTSVRRVGTGTYRVRTTTSSGPKTRTVTKTIHV